MSKTIWKPGTLIYPVPAVLVSCGAKSAEFNLITVSWTGTICTDPAMCYVSIRPERHSYKIIEKNQAFVINLTTEKMAKAVDWCGVKSGKDFDKFKETKLTPKMAEQVKAPIVLEAPINIECQVTEIKKLGSHDMFIAKVVCIQADKKFLRPNGSFDMRKAGLICYSHGQYYSLGQWLGKFGWSVQKPLKKSK